MSSSALRVFLLFISLYTAGKRHTLINTPISDQYTDQSLIHRSVINTPISPLFSLFVCRCIWSLINNRLFLQVDLSFTRWIAVILPPLIWRTSNTADLFTTTNWCLFASAAVWESLLAPTKLANVGLMAGIMILMWSRWELRSRDTANTTSRSGTATFCPSQVSLSPSHPDLRSPDWWSMIDWSIGHCRPLLVKYCYCMCIWTPCETSLRLLIRSARWFDFTCR